MPVAGQTPRCRNNLLNQLRQADYDLLAPDLKPVRSPANSILYHHGDNVATVYFPCGSTLVSFLITTDDAGAVETVMIGREGAVGGIVSQGKLPAYSQIMVQYGGDFLTLPVGALDKAKQASRSLDNLFARYADCLLAQIFQSTACNAAHSIEKRAAKWMLAAAERTGELEVALTQERMASMLGVGRSYISRVIKRFKQNGLLKVRRGRLTILDPHRLVERSCACDKAVREHFDLILSGVYPSEGDAN